MSNKVLLLRFQHMWGFMWIWTWIHSNFWNCSSLSALAYKEKPVIINFRYYNIYYIHMYLLCGKVSLAPAQQLITSCERFHAHIAKCKHVRRSSTPSSLQVNKLPGIAIVICVNGMRGFLGIQKCHMCFKHRNSMKKMQRSLSCSNWVCVKPCET